MAHRKAAKSGDSSAVKAPERGDLVWVDFTPHAGHEQAGRRPALVLSPREYNVKTGLSVCCPITSQSKGYPFEVTLPSGLPINGVILVDHIRNLDWQARKAKRIGTVGRVVLQEVWDLLSRLLDDTSDQTT